MLSFTLRRLAAFIATLFATSLVVFLVLEVLPGDPALLMLGIDAQPDAVAALRAKLGLDRPAVERYVVWMAGLLRGDLGVSHTYGTSVSELIGERLVVTLPLALIAMGLTTILALTLGIYAASKHN